MRVTTVCGLLLFSFLVLAIIFPESASAQLYGGSLESKVNGVTNSLLGFLLPAASIIGLIYAAILAATGDASAKSRMVLIVVASVVGFMAPLIIRWLQGIAS